MDIPLVSERQPESRLQQKIVKQVKKKVPIISWLPKYNLDSAVSDLIAGVTVGLTVIPQGIAYALVANLDPQFGLYSAFMGCFMYCIFGSVKDITIGPTAIMAIMTGDVFKEGETKIYGSFYADLLAFTSGILILLFGILKLGFLIDFISVPVITGFTSAAAITIASGQIKGLLGIYVLPENKDRTETHAGVVDDYINIFENIETVRMKDVGHVTPIKIVRCATDQFEIVDNKDGAGAAEDVKDVCSSCCCSGHCSISHFPGAGSKQYDYERWSNELNPTMVLDPWSDEVIFDQDQVDDPLLHDVDELAHHQDDVLHMITALQTQFDLDVDQI